MESVSAFVPTDLLPLEYACTWILKCGLQRKLVEGLRQAGHLTCYDALPFIASHSVPALQRFLWETLSATLWTKARTVVPHVSLVYSQLPPLEQFSRDLWIKICWGLVCSWSCNGASCIPGSIDQASTYIPQWDSDEEMEYSLDILATCPSETLSDPEGYDPLASLVDFNSEFEAFLCYLFQVARQVDRNAVYAHLREHGSTATRDEYGFVPSYGGRYCTRGLDIEDLPLCLEFLGVIVSRILGRNSDLRTSRMITVSAEAFVTNLVKGGMDPEAVDLWDLDNDMGFWLFTRRASGSTYPRDAG